MAALALEVGFAPTLAADVAVVYLKTGRVVKGEVNERTDAAELWVHATAPSAAVFSAVRWSEVESVEHGRRTYDAAAFQKLAEELKRPIPAQTFPKRHPIPAARPAAIPRIETLEIVADLANWDADVAPDGFELRLAPLAGQQVVPTNGVATVTLFGRRLGTTERLESQANLGFFTDGGSVREYAPRRGTLRYVEVGRWSVNLRDAAWSESGYVLRLPFRQAHPEFDLDLALDGQIDVQLRAVGQPLLSATTPVQLRSWSPFREELQLHRGTRFLPDEAGR